MFQIGSTVVSRDILEKRFVCNLFQCRGNCCVYGDAGAPIEAEEVEIIKTNFNKIHPYLQKNAIKSIENQGFAVKDDEGELVTPLVEGKECVYCYYEKGIARCAIEKAYMDGKISFRKPISCWLYPIRVSRLNDIHALVLHRWNICASGYSRGEKEGIPVYRYLKEPLVARFGREWYNELENVAEEWAKQNTLHEVL